MNNIPMGKLIHTKTNCSDDTAFPEHQNEVLSRLKRSVYPEWTLKKKQKKVSLIYHEHLYKMKEEKKQTDHKKSYKPIVFSTKYSPNYTAVTQIIKKHLSVLYSHDNQRSILQDGVQFVSRWAKTIGNIVSPSQYIMEEESSQTWLHIKGFSPLWS